jgi:hypothetical protein
VLDPDEDNAPPKSSSANAAYLIQSSTFAHGAGRHDGTSRWLLADLRMEEGFLREKVPLILYLAYKRKTLETFPKGVTGVVVLLVSRACNGTDCGTIATWAIVANPKSAGFFAHCTGF